MSYFLGPLLPAAAFTVSVAYLRPSADSNTGTWTNQAGSSTLYTMIDESSADDADYIQSSASPSNDVCTIKLEAPNGYTPLHPFTVKYRFKKSDSANTLDLRVRLLQGTTEIAQWSEMNVTNSYITQARTLSRPQFATITQFSDLYLEFRANQTG